MLIDNFHRHITYLRLSVTDRCNLRCRYCMPEKGVPKLDHQEILSYEEILEIVRAAASEGMTKVRLTGGEPLVRKGIIDFIRQLGNVPGLADLRMTTNGVLLKDMAENLIDAGIRRINISLDTLRPERFLAITGMDLFQQVRDGIEKALTAGFDKIKINCVPIRGFNDDEIEDFAKLSFKYPVEIRFIEFMPLGDSDFWSPEKVVTVKEIRERLEQRERLHKVDITGNEGPARVFQFPGAAGFIGFISPVTDHFCATCNRLRLTADGKLRLCLLSNREIDIKTPLRNGAGLEEIKALLRQAVQMKPGKHHLQEDIHAADSRSMNLIGG